jgi:VanZ family protein
MKSSIGAPFAGYVALAYTLVIVYASLQPFAGWRMPPDEVLRFLTAWPRYITASDIALNVVAYLPLGVMLYCALRPPLPAALAFVLATLLAAALSLALESVQMFLPSRIASNIDLLSNSVGAAAGALAALLLSLWNNPLAAARARIVRAGKLGDCGLFLIALWLVIQFHPSALAFGSGDVRDIFGVTPMFMHSSQAYALAEASVVGLAVIVLGLIVSLLVQSRRNAPVAMVVTLAATIGVKSIAVAMMGRSAHWLPWLTPGVAAGLVAGSASVAALMWLVPVKRAAIALTCLATSIVIVNITPDNPYQTLPAFMLSLQPTHLANFGNIVRVIAQGWALAAAMLLIGLARAGPARSNQLKSS